MITRGEVVQSVLQGKQVLESRSADVDHLRFLVNKMTYQLAQSVLAGDLEPDRLTTGLAFRGVAIH